MVSLCIKVNKTNVINYIMNKISKISLDNIVFVEKDFSKYRNVIIHYLGNDISVFYNEICSVLTDCIIDNYENLIIRSLLSLNYFYFDDLDLEAIQDNCNNIIMSGADISNISTIKNAIIDRKNYLWCDVLRYISYHKSILLDGFITFRAANYISCLDEIVDFSVSQFVINREYNEFIDMLKVYISSKTPIADLVHLIYMNEQSILLDKDKNIISLAKNNLDNIYLSDITFSSNDYALNSLLSLLPRKVVIHLISPADDFINTLQAIFGNVISICTDCDICKTYKLLNKQQGS